MPVVVFFWRSSGKLETLSDEQIHSITSVGVVAKVSEVSYIMIPWGQVVRVEFDISDPKIPDDWKGIVHPMEVPQ